MKGYRIFLAYYTLIATTLLLAWATFLGPKPQSLLWPLLVMPIAAYFALIFTGHPEELSEKPSKIPGLILAALFVTLAGVLAYTAANPKMPDNSSLSSQIEVLRQEVAKLNSPASTSSLDATTAAQLRQIKTDLARLSASQTGSSAANLLADDTSQVGVITVKDSKNATVNLYQDKTLKGAVVGKIEFGKTYPFIDKGKTWYLVLLSDKQGYVDATLVKEVN